MCLRCEELEAEVAYLRRELGIATDNAGKARMVEALRKARADSPLGAGRLVWALYCAKGRPLAPEAILEALPARTRNVEDLDRTFGLVRVWVWKARQAIGRDAISHVTGCGYRLTEIGVERVERMLNA